MTPSVRCRNAPTWLGEELGNKKLKYDHLLLVVTEYTMSGDDTFYDCDNTIVKNTD